MKGIFLGSFNPPHIGHVSICSQILNQTKGTKYHIDNIDIIPAYQNPNKNIDTSSSFDLRCQMCRDMFKELPHVQVNDIEGIIHPQNTWTLIQELKQRYKDDFVWIITSETFRELIEGKWFASTNLINGNKFIIVDFAHNSIFDNDNIKRDLSVSTWKFSSTWKDRMMFLTLSNKIDISSTVLREKIQNNEIVYPYIFNIDNTILRQLYHG